VRCAWWAQPTCSVNREDVCVYSNAFLTYVTCAFSRFLFTLLWGYRRSTAWWMERLLTSCLAVPSRVLDTKEVNRFLGKSRRREAGTCCQQMGSEEIKITKHLRETHKDCTLGSLEGNRGPASSHPICRTTRLSRTLHGNGSGAALLELNSTCRLLSFPWVTARQTLGVL
jgi:hypothetical protein